MHAKHLPFSGATSSLLLYNLFVSFSENFCGASGSGTAARGALCLYLTLPVGTPPVGLPERT